MNHFVSTSFRPYAIDAAETEFRDDAISIIPGSSVDPTCTIAVHIVDLTKVVAQGSILDDVAKLRLQSLYATSKPLHMLPPSLLHCASLSEENPNECITAIIQIDSNGRIKRHELVRSIIGPVRALSFEEVDNVLRGKDGLVSVVHQELRHLHLLSRQRAGVRGKQAPSINSSPESHSIRWRDGGGKMRLQPAIDSAARTIVKESLFMYSFAARGTAKRYNLLRLPQSEGFRLGTAPLRRYALLGGPVL